MSRVNFVVHEPRTYQSSHFCRHLTFNYSWEQIFCFTWYPIMLRFRQSTINRYWSTVWWVRRTILVWYAGKQKNWYLHEQQSSKCQNFTNINYVWGTEKLSVKKTKPLLFFCWIMALWCFGFITIRSVIRLFGYCRWINCKCYTTLKETSLWFTTWLVRRKVVWTTKTRAKHITCICHREKCLYHDDIHQKETV